MEAEAEVEAVEAAASTAEVLITGHEIVPSPVAVGHVVASAVVVAAAAAAVGEVAATELHLELGAKQATPRGGGAATSAGDLATGQETAPGVSLKRPIMSNNGQEWSRNMTATRAVVVHCTCEGAWLCRFVCASLLRKPKATRARNEHQTDPTQPQGLVQRLHSRCDHFSYLSSGL